jgi:prevent-host-death family protein
MAATPYRPPVQIATSIVPIAEFKAQASHLLDQIRENKQEALIITQHGKAAAVVLSPEEFDRLQTLQYERYFFSKIVEGQTAALAGEVVSHEEAKRSVLERLEPPKKKAAAGK